MCSYIITSRSISSGVTSSLDVRVRVNAWSLVEPGPLFVVYPMTRHGLRASPVSEETYDFRN